MKDPYLYKNSNILKNRANIRDEVELKEMEADYTIYRLSELVTSDFEGLFDCKRFRDIHYQIFRDVYEWAGEFRSINIEKNEPVLGEISIEYSKHEDILKEIEKALDEMNKVNWGEMGIEKVAKEFSEYMARLWKVHPYRDGNTRSIVTFCSLFIEAKGIIIDNDLFKDNAVYMRNALVAASASFQDLGDLRKTEYLYNIVYDALEKGAEFKEIIAKQIESAGCKVTKESVHKVVFSSRKKGLELTSDDVKKCLHFKR